VTPVSDGKYAGGASKYDAIIYL